MDDTKAAAAAAAEEIVSEETVKLGVELEKSSLDSKTKDEQDNNKKKDDEEKERLELAEKYKNEGNQAFKDQHFVLAIENYTKAIEYNPTEAALYGNRSFALADANKAIELDVRYIKGYYRRASSNLALGKFKLALKDYEFVVKVCPNDKDALSKLTECQKIVKRIAFEKAIAVDEHKKSAFDMVDIESMRRIEVENDYVGPKLDENHKVNQKFVEDLIQHYRDQKLLHRKHAYEILFQIYEYFKQQPSLIDVDVEPESKFTICGDIHGQYYDLLNIFKINGMPSEKNPYVIITRQY
jgi:serine/threonine-protein phosphatase 5